MSLEDRFPVHSGDAPAASAALVPHPSTNGSEEEPERRDLAHPKAVIRALLDGSVITVSSSGIVNEWNERARLAFGIEEEDAVGRALLDVIVPPDRRGPDEQRLAELLGGHYGALRPHRLSVRAQHRSGRDLATSLVLMPIPLNESSELSALLADVVAGGDEGHRERIRERHAGALKRLGKALAPDAEVPEQRQDNRVAGVVIVFQRWRRRQRQRQRQKPRRQRRKRRSSCGRRAWPLWRLRARLRPLGLRPTGSCSVRSRCFSSRPMPSSSTSCCCA